MTGCSTCGKHRRAPTCRYWTRTATPSRISGAWERTLVSKDLFVEIVYMDAAGGDRRMAERPSRRTRTFRDLDALKMVAEVLPPRLAAGSRSTSTSGTTTKDLVSRTSSPTAVESTVWPRAASGCPRRRCARSVTRPGKSLRTSHRLSAWRRMAPNCRHIPGQYPKYPGTVGWKTGLPDAAGRRAGLRLRGKEIFHYVLFAHSLGIPKEPCQKEADGVLISDLACQGDDVANPQ